MSVAGILARGGHVRVPPRRGRRAHERRVPGVRRGVGSQAHDDAVGLGACRLPRRAPRAPRRAARRAPRSAARRSRSSTAALTPPPPPHAPSSSPRWASPSRSTRDRAHRSYCALRDSLIALVKWPTKRPLAKARVSGVRELKTLVKRVNLISPPHAVAATPKSSYPYSTASIASTSDAVEYGAISRLLRP